MKTDISYLSDEELLKLMAEAEEDLVMAPPDLIPGVMQQIKTSGKSREDREREFRRYCIRVMASMAAAIALVFTMPSLMETVDKARNENAAQEISKEKDSTLFTEILGGHTFFSEEGPFGSFFDKKGGSKT